MSNHYLITTCFTGSSFALFCLRTLYESQRETKSRSISNCQSSDANPLFRTYHRQSISPDKQTRDKPGILFLGTGSSTGCPKPLCAILNKYNTQIQQSATGARFSCQVSQMAIQGDPKYNKNYRNNPSILISHFNNDDKQIDKDDLKDDKLKHVIIDVGKTFREGAIRWMPSHNQSIDAIVLTHEHMDAIGGLDDVRGFQKVQKTEHGFAGVPVPVFLSQRCFEAISRQFHYLVPKKSEPLEEDSIKGSKKVERHVASLDYQIVKAFEPFVAAGLKITPLPVMHGEDLICLGFSFSIRNYTSHESKVVSQQTHVVYLSDISRMIPSTQAYILEKLPPTDILVVDSLLVEKRHPTHFCLTQAVEIAQELGAKQTYIVGMNCDAFKPHDEMNEELSKLEGVNVQLAHDGLVLHFTN